MRTDNWLPTTFRGIFLGAVLLAAVAPSAEAADYFTLVPNGKFVSVGRVVLVAPRDGKVVPVSMGTGTLIAPDLVLTAAHVVMDAFAPDAIIFEVTLSDGKAWTSRAVAYRTHPGFVDMGKVNANEGAVIDLDMMAVAASDVALLRLTNPIPESITFPELGPLPDTQGSPVESVGFGQIEGPTVASSAKRSGTLEFHEKTSMCAIFRAPVGKLQRTNHGDSGGPLLAIENGVERVVAITHGYSRYDKIDGLDPTAYGLYATIEDNRTWIDSARSELGAIRMASGPAFYLIRAPQHGSGQLALSRRQIEGLLQVIPEARVIQRVFSRGVSEPIPAKVVEHWASRYKLVASEHFVPAAFSQPSPDAKQ